MVLMPFGRQQIRFKGVESCRLRVHGMYIHVHTNIRGSIKVTAAALSVQVSYRMLTSRFTQYIVVWA